MLVTILFMGIRIKAKVFPSDTLNLFMHRIRNIVTGITAEYQIGLFDIVESNALPIANSWVEEMALKAPLESNQIIKHMDEIKKEHSYLVLYIDSIDFGEENFTIGVPEVIENQKFNYSNDYFKTVRGSTIANQRLICPFSNCLKNM